MKLSLDGGFTCPNRDGTVGTIRGVYFGGEEGSGELAGSRTFSIKEAGRRAKKDFYVKNGIQINI